MPKNKLTRSQIVTAKFYMKEQFESSGQTAWLEGWACGWTDPVHEYSNADDAKEELLNYIQKLNERW